MDANRLQPCTNIPSFNYHGHFIRLADAWRQDDQEDLPVLCNCTPIQAPISSSSSQIGNVENVSPCTKLIGVKIKMHESFPRSTVACSIGCAGVTTVAMIGIWQFTKRKRDYLTISLTGAARNEGNQKCLLLMSF